MSRRTLGKPTGSSYSYGISVSHGRLVFISGIVAMDENGNVIAPGDMETQTRHIFDRMDDLLREAGADFRDVVKITTYVTDMSQYAAFSKIRGEVFQDGYPASATVGVSALVFDGLVVEVEAVAVV